MYEAEQLTLEPLELRKITRNAAEDGTPVVPASFAAPEPVSFDDPVPVHGNARLLLHRQFVSAFLPARRDVIVALPPDYFRTGLRAGRRYPVLYLQDGQNLFDASTSFIKGSFWDVQTTADRLIEEAAIEPLIVVGI